MDGDIMISELDGDLGIMKWMPVSYTEMDMNVCH